ncbi:hypothetical protein [Xylanibacillus composti]|uniref:hypothetical protein n=1 Tax=Xylanibacillus composti TaxID=1572762 RepID=UPI001BD16F2A|nr:hypothetical protein [Xylanibacillus composti]
MYRSRLQAGQHEAAVQPRLPHQPEGDGRLKRQECDAQDLPEWSGGQTGPE